MLSPYYCFDCGELVPGAKILWHGIRGHFVVINKERRKGFFKRMMKSREMAKKSFVIGLLFFSALVFSPHVFAAATTCVANVTPTTNTQGTYTYTVDVTLDAVSVHDEKIQITRPGSWTDISGIGSAAFFATAGDVSFQAGYMTGGDTTFTVNFNADAASDNTGDWDITYNYGAITCTGVHTYIISGAPPTPTATPTEQPTPTPGYLLEPSAQTADRCRMNYDHTETRYIGDTPYQARIYKLQNLDAFGGTIESYRAYFNPTVNEAQTFPGIRGCESEGWLIGTVQDDPKIYECTGGTAIGADNVGQMRLSLKEFSTNIYPDHFTATYTGESEETLCGAQFGSTSGGTEPPPCGNINLYVATIPDFACQIGRSIQSLFTIDTKFATTRFSSLRSQAYAKAPWGYLAALSAMDLTNPPLPTPGGIPTFNAPPVILHVRNIAENTQTDLTFAPATTISGSTYAQFIPAVTAIRNGLKIFLIGVFTLSLAFLIVKNI